MNATELKFFNRLREKVIKATDVFKEDRYVGIWKSVIDKYPDAAHFIFELLQNADDAGASKVRIYLDEKGLTLSHNGVVQFTITDPENEKRDRENGKLGHVNSITAIGFSTKSNDLGSIENKIGKFGVGFKSVFQHTNTPHIYDDKFQFKLIDYIVPEILNEDHPERNIGETLFYLPFDKSDSDRRNSFEHIKRKLNELIDPILFLQNLKEIEWQVEGQNHKSYRKEIVEYHRSNNIYSELVKLTKGSKTNHLWLFTKQIQIKEEGVHHISVGYYLNEKSQIDTTRKPPVFCFFPTKEKLNYCFVMHAPFVLVDNRQQIKENNQINEFLFNELATLAAESLIMLRDIGIKNNQFLIHENILDIVPLENEYLSTHIPFYHAFLDILLSDKLFLSDKRYISASQAVLSNTPIQSILSTSQLNNFLACGRFQNENIDEEYYEEILITEPYGFIFTKSKRLTDEKKSHFLSELQVLRLDLDEFGDLFTSEFIKSQNDEWLIKFYKFLCESRQLIEKYQLNFGGYSSCKLKYKPILKLENGNFAEPYKENDIQNVFVPDSQSTIDSYNYISNSLLDNKEVKRLLEILKIGTPNYEAEILSKILPKYSRDEIDIIENVQDISKIAYELKYNSNHDRFQFLLNEVEKVIWIRSINCKGKEEYRLVKDVLFPNEKLKLLYGNIEDAFFVDIEFYLNESQDQDSINFLFDRLSFQKDLNVDLKIYDDIDDYPYPALLGEIKDIDGALKKHDNRSNTIVYYLNDIKISDFGIDFLENVIKNQYNIQKSNMLWQFLLTNLLPKHFRLNLTFRPHGDYRYNNKQITKDWSQLAFVLKKEKWLFNKSGQLKSVKDITSDELHPIYDNISQNLLNLLGIKESYRLQDERLIDQMGSDELKEDLELGRRLREIGISFSDLEANKDFLFQLKSKEGNDNAELPKREKIDKKAKDINLKDLFSNKTVPDKVQNNSDKFSEKSFEIIEPQIDESLYRIRDLKNEVGLTETYTYSWFEKLMELEYLQSNEEKNTSKPLKIYFSSMEKELGSDRLVILKNPNRPIPLSIENQDIIDIAILYSNGSTDQLTISSASVRDFSVRLKVNLDQEKKVNDIFQSGKKIIQVALTVSSQVKILDKLRAAFKGLKLDPEFSLRTNLHSENLKFIFGPPGTGKTTYLSKEISSKVNSAENCKILVLTPTNKAADVITSRLLEQNKSNDEWIWRFVTTNDPVLEVEEVVYDRNSQIERQNKVCVISTIARYPYDGFKTGLFREIDWDYIVIDEASMIPLIQIIYPIYNSENSKIIIAGDPFQIEPIVIEDLWSGENIYKMINLLSFDNPETIPNSFEIVNLSTQYRSIPSIGDLFSKYAYSGKLSHFRSNELKRKIQLEMLNFSDINFITFPVNSNSTLFDSRKLSNSNVHIYSALFTFEFVNFLSKNLTVTKLEKPWSIGIICPYKSQAEMINKLWENRINRNHNINVTIGTIHGFQGDECDVILAVYNPPSSGMIRQSDKVFINKKNILNVAISRARDSLFILMPDNEYSNYSNMHELLSIGGIASSNEGSTLSFSSNKLEEIMFNNPNYIEENTFVTMHQMANVFSKSEFMYDIKIDENSVDIQINI